MVVVLSGLIRKGFLKEVSEVVWGDELGFRRFIVEFRWSWGGYLEYVFGLR